MIESCGIRDNDNRSHLKNDIYDEKQNEQIDVTILHWNLRFLSMNNDLHRDSISRFLRSNS